MDLFFSRDVLQIDQLEQLSGRIDTRLGIRFVEVLRFVRLFWEMTKTDLFQSWPGSKLTPSDTELSAWWVSLRDVPQHPRLKVSHSTWALWPSWREKNLEEMWVAGPTWIILDHLGFLKLAAKQVTVPAITLVHAKKIECSLGSLVAAVQKQSAKWLLCHLARPVLCPSRSPFWSHCICLWVVEMSMLDPSNPVKKKTHTAAQLLTHLESVKAGKFE